jgi:ABC-2 type transport system permease protein
MAGYFLFRGGPLSGVNNIIDPRLVAGGMVGFSAFITWTLGNNMLGMEGQGLQSLLLSPVPRTDIFLGKALGILSVTGSAVVIAGLAAMAVAPGWPIVAGVVAAVAVGLVILGVEAVFSVAFPYPVNLESTTRVSPLAAGGGCVGALILTFGTPVVSGIAGLPPVALMGLAWLTGAPPAWQLLASGAGLAYGMGALLLGARLAGQRLARREPEVIAATRLED